jgi:hypothetical protein
MLRRAAIGKQAIIGLAWLVAAAGFGASAHARPLQQEYATSKSPYWMVGTFSKKLSDACQRREFGQIRQYRYTIGFAGDKGQGLTGIADTQFNLYDPKGLAEKGFTYHFFDEGYSDCRVYFAKPKPRRGQAR